MRKVKVRACSISGCDRDVHSRGMCRKHQSNWRRNATREELGRLFKECLVDKCTVPVLCRGYCNKHYQKFYKYGDPLVGKSRFKGTTEERFLSYVQRGNDDSCWPWVGYIDVYGYGSFSVKNIRVASHRFAYELFIEKIPEGMVADHECHNRDKSCKGGDTCLHRRCVNPFHIDIVENAENIRRGRGGDHWKQKTHCPQGHPYDEENTILYEGRRYCRKCTYERNYAYTAKKKAEGTYRPKKLTCNYGHPYTEENIYISPNGNYMCRTCLKERNNGLKGAKANI